MFKVSPDKAAVAEMLPALAFPVTDRVVPDKVVAEAVPVTVRVLVAVSKVKLEEAPKSSLPSLN